MHLLEVASNLERASATNLNFKSGFVSHKLYDRWGSWRSAFPSMFIVDLKRISFHYSCSNWVRCSTNVGQTQFRERLFPTTCSMVSKVAVLLTSEVIVTTLTPIVPSLLLNRLDWLDARKWRPPLFGVSKLCYYTSVDGVMQLPFNFSIT